ncbi:hypothetical protein [Nocardia inohanensis]|uniref:hypothetical protein n=1 Tax=Nocardia inohanensis TaxID=209246 RepID=UPI0012F90961|nr:hypothetical protein [Nocardia inohanensis]
MTSIVGVQVGLATKANPPSKDELEAFRRDVSDLMIANGRSLYSYIDRGLDYAIRSRIDGWYEPSIHRSAIQLLIDDYPGGSSVFDEEALDLLDEMDEMLNDRAPDVPPLPESIIPPGMPESHWWWHLPSGDPGEVAARDHLLS